MEANRDGMLSDNQIQRLIHETNTWNKVGRLIGLYLSIGLLLNLIVQHLQISFVVMRDFLIPLVIVGIPAFVAWRLKRDANNKTVLSVTGKIRLRHNGRTTTIFVRTGASQLQFYVQGYLPEIFQPEYVYTLYYLPITRRIMAAEHRADTEPLTT